MSKINHPCLIQLGKCHKNTKCNFIGVPNDICIFYLQRRCKYNKCKYRHPGESPRRNPISKKSSDSEIYKIWNIIKKQLSKLIPALIGLLIATFTYLIAYFTKIFKNKTFDLNKKNF